MLKGFEYSVTKYPNAVARPRIFPLFHNVLWMCCVNEAPGTRIKMAIKNFEADNAMQVLYEGGGLREG